MCRCSWVTKEPIYIEYHDKVWGRAVFDEYELFEKLCLDGQQAGLSWLTVLKKQESYRLAYDNFDPYKIALYDQEKVERLLNDKGIIRNRLKIESIIRNAKGFIAIKEQGLDFSEFLWGFVDGKQIVNQWSREEQLPTETEASRNMSKALKKLGFNFVGPTICYAFMQAVGMVNDHRVDCLAYQASILKKD
ncbi:DNA-3-methyladenine glycosylase I [Paraferrimonas haliotis]|uniref:DNA-3-methyladenine glycosylase I n=2 Tax=Paraferrimonas haliotis TaxID=2013866 RepID=A0AA37WXY2_9GAMM|nr:DNA-3-methyladenine glycosylase I [Paraferrimonas haliotis]